MIAISELKEIVPQAKVRFIDRMFSYDGVSALIERLVEFGYALSSGRRQNRRIFMRLLIVNTLPSEDPLAQTAIRELTTRIPEHRVIHTADMHISPCIGCNACWLVTPGICAVKDGYEEILKAYLSFDATVFLSGTALGFVNHQMKNVIDRVLPLFDMYTCFRDGQMRHVPRYDKQYRFGLLYAGAADQVYLQRWMDRVCVNIGGQNLGAYPMDQCGEVLACIS